MSWSVLGGVLAASFMEFSFGHVGGPKMQASCLCFDVLAVTWPYLSVLEVSGGIWSPFPSGASLMAPLPFSML